jgi:hypothetical protein
MLIIMLMTAVMTRVVVVVIMTKFFPRALLWQILSVACVVGIVFEVFN